MTSKFQIFKLSFYSVCLALVLGGCRIEDSRTKIQDSGSDVGKGEVYREIRVGDKKLRVEIADTPGKITKGLGYRDEIGSPSTSSGQVDGMLFVMPKAYVPSFWMKGMRFGLDIVWIKCEREGLVEVGECRVEDVTDNIPAPEDPENPRGIFRPRSGVEISHVLEVEQDAAKRWGVSSGDEVEIGKLVK